MQTFERSSTSSPPVEQWNSWHFTATPDDVQRCTVRRLALCGLPAEEIAARTGWTIDRVRQAMPERPDLRETFLERSRRSLL